MKRSGNTVSIRALSLSLGGVVMAGVLAAPGHAQDPASAETQAMILGPLQAELPTLTPVKILSDIELDANPYALRYTARSLTTAEARTDLARPAASRFAEAVLATYADRIARDGLSAFSTQEAVLATTPSGSLLSVSMLEADRPTMIQLAFDPTYAETAGSALNPGAGLEGQRMALNYEGAFDSPGGSDGFDIGVSPRAGVSIGQDGPSAAAGATVRLGQYLDAFESGRPAWWLFAGADRQAVMYDPGRGFDMRNALAMEPYAMVGDAQAGVAMRLGGTDISLAYIHRETRYEMATDAWETTEGFAAFSLTWRR
jgi:hypothetical protein